MQGSDIKEYLDKNGIKQSFLSKETGIPTNSLNQMLNNGRKIEVDEYMKICYVLNLPLDYFKPKEI
ncbi:MAG: helix-turn-helix transcriptional regulator [Anaerostipes sp.]|nr:helix-turn-helix transcriptional regulator [Anaerostipes sp.]